ncbi:MAG TPA: DUF6644 family protein [Bryobacteraceae bacterium]|jgi:hypothetical protein
MLVGSPIGDAMKNIGDAMNNTEWAFPLAECFHIAAFAFAIGTIAVVDLRLLGLGITRQSAAQLLKDTHKWTLWGLVVVLFAGVPIYISQPEIYNVNSAFWFKMYCILAAIVFHYAVLRPVVRAGPSPMVAKLIAIVSLLLWTGTVFGGLFIAFV